MYRDRQVFSYQNLSAKLYLTNKRDPLVVCNTETRERELIAGYVDRFSKIDCSVLLITGFSWNDALSPWSAPAVFKGSSGFKGGARSYLDTLENKLIPEVLSKSSIDPAYKIIAGYSLSGLFSLYAAFNSSVFAGVVCASGSLWFPGFPDYALSHKLNSSVLTAYLSLGDREQYSSNPLLRSVYEKTRLIFNNLTDVDSCFQLNAGGHFKDAAERTAKGVVWTLERMQEKAP